MQRSFVRLSIPVLALPLAAALWFAAPAGALALQDPKPAPEGRQDGGRQDGGRPDGPPERGQDRGGRGEGRGPREGRGPNLHGSMESLGREMERVHQSISDPTKNDATITGLGRMLGAVGFSIGGEPKSLSEQPEAARAASKLAFRRELAQLAKELAEIELLVLDGKNADAAARFDKLAALRDAAHERYGVEDEGERKPSDGGKPADGPKPGEAPKKGG